MPLMTNGSRVSFWNLLIAFLLRSRLGAWIIVGLILALGGWGVRNRSVAEKTTDRADGQILAFSCPKSCEVATDSAATAIIQEAKSPGFKNHAAAYKSAVEAGRIIRITNGTFGRVRTKKEPGIPAGYSTIELVDGPHAGQRVIAHDRFLR
jgi:hypothetical protein